TGDERGCADRLSGVARSSPARSASECGLAAPHSLAGGRGYDRPLLMALTSSPLPVSPLNSQKNAPPRPWLFAQFIFPAMVDGVSYDHQLLPQCAYAVPAIVPVAGQDDLSTL